MNFIIFYLLVGFSISIWASLLSRGKKIKPNIRDTVLTVFLWLPYLVQVFWWRATLTDEEKDYINKLINEDEKP